MNTQPRDKKGKFIRTRMSRVDAIDKVMRYRAIAMDRLEVIKEQRQTIGNLNGSCGDYANALDREKIKNKKLKIKLRLWVSLAFILGTIFFMIIAKR